MTKITLVTGASRGLGRNTALSVTLPRPEGRGFGVSRTALPIPRRSDS
jgi:NAD(P)-dependent dehydrogenase (short-subunit alcohol dehydrogenase family)